jgi:hypothetical protein
MTLRRRLTLARSFGSGEQSSYAFFTIEHDDQGFKPQGYPYGLVLRQPVCAFRAAIIRTCSRFEKERFTPCCLTKQNLKIVFFIRSGRANLAINDDYMRF